MYEQTILLRFGKNMFMLQSCQTVSEATATGVGAGALEPTGAGALDGTDRPTRWGILG